jgi:hypothetical protein
MYCLIFSFPFRVALASQRKFGENMFNYFVTFWALAAVNMKIIVFQNVTPGGLVDI